MTLFKRTEGTLEELDKVLVSLETDAGVDVADKKRRLDQMTEMAEVLGQNCSKLRKAAQESDPTKVGYMFMCGIVYLCALINPSPHARQHCVYSCFRR